MLLALLAPIPGSAQSLAFGGLQGMTTDTTGRAVAYAEVRARERSSGASRWTTSAPDGSFRFEVMPAGRYDVIVEALGYRPLVHLDVAVAIGQPARVLAVLRHSPPPVTQIDTVHTRRAGRDAGSWLLERGYGDLVGTRRSALDAAGFSTTADAQSIEGLPWRRGEAVIDGARANVLGAAAGDGSDGMGAAFPVRGLAAGAAGGLGFDSEVSGSGVGLRLLSLRGGRETASRALIEGSATGLGASFITSGPLQGDTAQAVVGIEFQRNEIERPSYLGTDAASILALTDAASNTYGIDLTPYGAPAVRTDERWSGFGRLDWQPADRFAISARGSGTRFVSRGLPEHWGPEAAFGADYESHAIQGLVSVYSRLTGRFAAELRASADVGAASGRAPALAPTAIAALGQPIGGPNGRRFEDSRTTPRVVGMFHAALGAHRLKAGVSVASHRFGARSIDGTGNAWAFGELTDFAAGQGVFRQVDVGSPIGDFRIRETSFFLQDAWELADGLDVTLGLRWDRFLVPVDRIETNAAWAAASGLVNSAARSPARRASPRFGIRWELGGEKEWVIEGGAGVFQELPDRRDIAEVLSLDRSTTVRYAAGTLTGWPGAAPGAIDLGGTLSMLGPDFEGPRTQRMALALTRRLGTWSSTLSGVYRHTDFLTRRRDLNLPAAPVGVDQHGRPLYGVLEQVGTLLTANPGSNRRFTGFDAVQALESTGTSDFYGVTFAMERVREQGLSVGVSYTYSHTTDDLLGADSRGASPFPDGLGGTDWASGRSDLDVPHRVLAALDWSSGASGALRVGAIYRLESGRPFTPGVRAGVDANGDGRWDNDPAFVDPGLPGMGTLFDEHACLRRQAGQFAERNSCREALAHRLDLRVTVRLAELAIGRMELLVDALDVVGAERGPVDRALVLVDGTSTLNFDPVSGVTTIPWAVNPAFGRLLADRSPGILWRVGLRITP